MLTIITVFIKWELSSIKKLRVGIIFGGKSAEHEVSLQSAKNIIEAIDKDKYDVLLIGIDKNGQWYLNEDTGFLLNANNPKLIQLNKSNDEVTLIPGKKENQIIHISGQQTIGRIDVAFPVLHGPFGEDGTVQGMLKLANIPYVGAGVLGSAVGMDKDVMKRLLRDAGIPVARHITYRKRSIDDLSFQKVQSQLGTPVFVKPANLGSSVGISKAGSESVFMKAVNLAFQFDQKIILEEFIEGREIECSVLGNDQPVASIPGEVIPSHEFYSYEAKYIDEKGAILEIPAKLSEETVKRVQDLAVKSFEVLCCEGMARVDFFVKEDKVIVNEINTIPGFTRISMYPKLWEASGIPYAELIDRLINLALERHREEQQLKTRAEEDV
jgi:D-alanine-D-alanine ligase